MNAELSFVERCTMKLGIAAVTAARSFMDARGFKPSAGQIDQISRELTPLVIAQVGEVAPTLDSSGEVFGSLILWACAAGVAAAKRVTGLGESEPVN